MTLAECPREDEVTAAVLSHRWPEQCDDSLRAHATGCEVCSGLVAVASLLSEERRAMYEGVTVPAAGQVWWRAAIRARVEATRTVSRPQTWLFGVAAASVIGLAIAMAGLLLAPVQQAASWSNPLAWLIALDFKAAAASLPTVLWAGGLLTLGAIACLVLAPIALYVVLSDD